MIRKITKITYWEHGNRFFSQTYAWVYLEGPSKTPSYIVTTKDLENMAFGC